MNSSGDNQATKYVSSLVVAIHILTVHVQVAVVDVQLEVDVHHQDTEVQQHPHVKLQLVVFVINLYLIYTQVHEDAHLCRQEHLLSRLLIQEGCNSNKVLDVVLIARLVLIIRIKALIGILCVIEGKFVSLIVLFFLPFLLFCRIFTVCQLQKLSFI